MRFTKMHGIGNDYVYINGFAESIPADLPTLARAMSARHFGIGSDGLILILPSKVADARMRMFNADGSESEMCGNGLRCVAKYVYDHDIVEESTITIETGAWRSDGRSATAKRQSRAGAGQHGDADPDPGGGADDIARDPIRRGTRCPD